MKGVTFGDTYHSYRDWGLYLKKPPVASPPEPWTHIIEVPGSNAIRDLSTILTKGNVTYKPRDLEMEFVTHCKRDDWETRFSPILNYLHGQTMNIMFDDDAPYSYTGRVIVKAPTWEKNHIVSFKVTAKVNPHKNSNEGWKL